MLKPFLFLRQNTAVFAFQRFGFIRKADVTSAADSAYRSSKNEAWPKANMLKRRIPRRKPKERTMPEHTARANAAKSPICARVEHVFTHQKNRTGLFISIIGIARAQTKLNLANLAHTFDCLIFGERRAARG